MKKSKTKLVVVENAKKRTLGFDGPYLEMLAMWQMMPPA